MNKKDKPERTRLNKARVLEAAVVMADERGLEGFGMRQLAQKLGVVPMALYKHVANKEDLLNGMIDIVFSEIKLPSGEVPWRSAMRDRAFSARAALQRHPWAIGLMESQPSPGPANLRHHEAVLAGLRQGGFSFQAAIHAYSLLDAYIYGYALQEKNVPSLLPTHERRSAGLGSNPAEEYPYLKETTTELLKGYDYTQEFEFGLNLILDGLDELQNAPEPGRSWAPRER